MRQIALPARDPAYRSAAEKVVTSFQEAGGAAAADHLERLLAG
ncbi:hypothetical protein [Amycolatopsis sp. cmx-11-51]